MICARGYGGSVVQLRRIVRQLRPLPLGEASCGCVRLRGTGPADWGSFGCLGERRLSCFVMVLSWSRAIHAVFTLDQSMESFLRGHIEAFEYFGGVPRTVLYDNLKSAVLERRGQAIRFHPRLLDLCGHYHFAPRPVAPARGNEKGRVERQIQYLRSSFSRRAASRRRGPQRTVSAVARGGCPSAPQPVEAEGSVAEALEREHGFLLGLPAHRFEHRRCSRCAREDPYLHFDRNLYSIPHRLVRKPLVLVADVHTVRILDGHEELTCHAAPGGARGGGEGRAHRRVGGGKTRGSRIQGRDRLRAAVPTAIGSSSSWRCAATISVVIPSGFSACSMTTAPRSCAPRLRSPSSARPGARARSPHPRTTPTQRRAQSPGATGSPR